MLNIVASFFRFTIPPSKNDVLQRKTRTKQKCFSLHGNSVPLFFQFIKHPEKAEQKPNKNVAQRIMQQSWLRAKTGRSPKGITAQGSALGLSLLTNWRAVSATGASEMLVRPFLLLFQSAS